MTKRAGIAPKSRKKHQEPGVALTLDVIQQIEAARVGRNLTFAELERKSGVSARAIKSWLEPRSRERAATTDPLRPRLLRDVLITLGIGRRLTRKPGYPTRTLGETDVFLAAAMESLGDGYQLHRSDILRVVKMLRDTLHLRVFYAGEDRPAAAAFEDEAWALADNVDILERSRRFVLIYPGPARGHTRPLASSALVEVGYAIATRLPILAFFQRGFETLPFLMRMLPQVYDGSHLVRYRQIDDVITAIGGRHRSFFAVDE